jgi:tRNA U34 2-thiouridine synthase MnmA/TrmU
MSYKAIVLFSGGLDSTLAALTVMRQGVEVTAIRFLTPFDPNVSARTSFPEKTRIVAGEYGFDVESQYLDEPFLEIVRKPLHGYGKNMNPCIDCRILMLKKVRAYMDSIHADFIVTGEVPGQRPMSQGKGMLYHIDKEAGVSGYVLRPLSAKLLTITAPEANGIIDREKLSGFSGRSRKPQMALAKEFELKDYPLPAGGCLLTEPNYAHRLKELLTHNPLPTIRDIDLLRIGRHFRFSPRCKIVVGRDENENTRLEALSENGCLLRVEDYGSPLTLVTGEINDEAITVAASICARYSDAKNLSGVEVTVMYRDETYKVTAAPAENKEIESLRIEKEHTKKTATV